MSEAPRYDRLAEGYAAHWGPVIRPAALATLDLVPPDRAPERVLDIGSGTGTLALAALGRWPAARVAAVDPSDGMLALARRAAGDAERTEGGIGAADRLETLVAPADRLPFDDASFDLAVSSFVLQLVPNRFRAIREVRRVLRPGALFSWVSWLAHDDIWPPDVDFDDALEDVGEEPREWNDRPGDLRDTAAATAQMRRAGFAEVTADSAMLVHEFTIDGYVGFMAEFDEEDLVQSMEPELRTRFEAALRRRLARRRPEQLALRQPTVIVRGVRR